MGRKSSIHLTDESVKAIERTATIHADGTVEQSVSGRINVIIGRYSRVIDHHAPEFSLGEWCAICDANNGCLLDVGEGYAPTMLWANVADTPGIGDKWHVDADALVQKMRTLTFAESIAVAEIVQRFWSDCSRQDNEEWLIECGAKIGPVVVQKKKRKE